MLPLFLCIKMTNTVYQLTNTVKNKEIIIIYVYILEITLKQ